MNSIGRNPFFYFSLFLGVALGLCFPFFFLVLDIKQLGLSYTLTNMYEVFKSQNIYAFSTILFPFLCSSISGLYFYTSSQNKKLVEQESYIKNVLNTLTDCILVCNSVGKIQYANRTYYNLYKSEDHSVSSLLGIANLSRVPRGQFFELCLVNNRGEKRSVNYIVYKLQNKSVSYEDNDFIISIRDIEDIKQNEEIIVSQREQLFEASKLSALGEMASGFAHEINNPLAIIKGRLAITERGIKKEEMSKEAILKNLEICKTTVERITKIIVGLRNLAHGSSSSESEEVAVKNLVEDPIIMAILKMSGKGIDFSTDIKSVEEELVVCNRIQISQVLMNILGNAIDAVEGQESPWIKLSVEASDSQVKFIVIDSGKGIPLDVQKRMFNPMYTTKSVGKGTGLGLSISRAIVEKHNGRIQLNNESPNTCFEIILPRATVSKQLAA